jgi:hypothetical protein
MIVFTRGFLGRRGGFRFDALDLLYTFFRQDVVEPAAAIPYALRRLLRVIDIQVRTVREF